MKALIQLGRFGDICNVLPLLEEANRNGKRAALVVAPQFADVFDGISYADRLVFNGPDTQPALAASRASAAGYEPVVSQCYGEGVVQERLTDSFAREAWRKVGLENRWEQISLFFDRRNRDREAKLAEGIDWSRPVVLYNGAGQSSPFPEFNARMQRVIDSVPEVNFVNLEAIRAEKFFDLLGLLDRALALITIDTMTLHLARASAVPVLAFHNHAAWLASPRFANTVLRRSYKEFDADEVAQVIDWLRPSMRAPKVVHVWPEWDMPDDDRRRFHAAARSWNETTNWHHIPFDNRKAARDSRRIGDDRPVPFVRDVLQFGLDQTRYSSDIVVLTNSDIGFSRGIDSALVRNVQAMGSAFAYRFNFDSAPENSDVVGTTAGYWDGGLDLFAFRRDWLTEHLRFLPDMLMGRTHWDLVYRHIVKQTGGGDLTGHIWHERHKSFWTQHRENAGNVHNLAISKEFFSRNDPTRPYRWTFRECCSYRNR